MTMRPCLTCGEPSDGRRCPEHTVDTKAPATDRGYDWAWTKLSARARRLQPFCTDCGATEDLQLDHTEDTWARKAARKTIRLQDTGGVVCGPCNRARGAARGPSATRGGTPEAGAADPPTRQSFALSRREVS